MTEDIQEYNERNQILHYKSSTMEERWQYDSRGNCIRMDRWRFNQSGAVKNHYWYTSKFNEQDEEIEFLNSHGETLEMMNSWVNVVIGRCFQSEIRNWKRMEWEQKHKTI